jgi:hypothetical protein
MLDSFFGIHPHVIRSGLWGQMKPGEKDLYIYLMEESERCCTRQLTITDAQVKNSVRTASRTLCNARKKLQERGLIGCKRGQGNKYRYVICNPKTGQPYAGNPRDPIIVPKRSANQNVRGARAVSGAIQDLQQYALSQSPRPDEALLEQHGVSGIFA